MHVKGSKLPPTMPISHPLVIRWRCERLFRRAGSKCEEIVVPEYGHTIEEGLETGWACNRGFEKSGDTCLRVVLPDHAYLTNRVLWSRMEM